MGRSHAGRSDHGPPDQGRNRWERPIVSVHVPKTAGTSFLAFLEDGLRGERLVHDWLGGPRNEGGAAPLAALAQGVRDRIDRLGVRARRSGIGVLHGHFLASKYAFLDAPMFAWVRDPVDRVVSHYRFFERFEDPRNLLSKAVRQGLSLIDFAALPGMRNLQTRYLDVPLNRFTFVGRTERFAEDLQRARARIGLPGGAVPHENANPEKSGAAYGLPLEARQRISELNQADARLYTRVCELFHGDDHR